MAPHRLYVDQALEELPGKRLRCRTCLDFVGTEAILSSRKAIKKHLASKTHQEASHRKAEASRPPKATNISMQSIDETTEDSSAMAVDNNKTYFTIEAFFRSTEDDSAPACGDVIQDPWDILSTGWDQFSNGVLGDGGATAGETTYSSNGNSVEHEPDGFEETAGHNNEDDDDLKEGDPEWFPYPSKPAFYLDLLDHLPRLRLSDDQLKAVIWVMKQSGTRNVPSFYCLRKVQEKISSSFFTPEKYISIKGTEFWMNNPIESLRLEWANPNFRKHIKIYPEITERVGEFWQAKKYVSEVPDDQLTPMWANWTESPHRHFFIKELARLCTGEMIVPLRWVVYDGEEHALAIDMQEIQPVTTLERILRLQRRQRLEGE
ncbi:hypothetical protein Agabi119p4_5719 [Agaricus bisporus var. burnettii]|uniref:Uncharacterized protein n=1 Tax=Agaricus bisporus var. burnettii TaxID=192524 RepID=A0A8H7F269_AGABI|nr:hypothetical protein Agabi119p4_5719 [Agaricus bisporus var. burnettii]